MAYSRKKVKKKNSIKSKRRYIRGGRVSEWKDLLRAAATKTGLMDLDGSTAAAIGLKFSPERQAMIDKLNEFNINTSNLNKKQLKKLLNEQEAKKEAEEQDEEQAEQQKKIESAKDRVKIINKAKEELEIDKPLTELTSKEREKFSEIYDKLLEESKQNELSRLKELDKLAKLMNQSDKYDDVIRPRNGGKRTRSIKRRKPIKKRKCTKIRNR